MCVGRIIKLGMHNQDSISGARFGKKKYCYCVQSIFDGPSVRIQLKKMWKKFKIDSQSLRFRSDSETSFFRQT